MLVAEDFLVILEDTVARPGTHEVVVALAGGKAAAHSCPSLVTSFTTLWKCWMCEKQAKDSTTEHFTYSKNSNKLENIMI